MPSSRAALEALDRDDVAAARTLLCDVAARLVLARRRLPTAPHIVRGFTLVATEMRELGYLRAPLPTRSRSA